MVIGGDFNLRPGSPGFQAISDLMKQHSLMDEISAVEVIQALTKSKRKAQSTCGFSPSALGQLAQSLALPLAHLFNLVLRTGRVPESWLETSVIFIHKKGPTSDPDNYRTIAIENPFLKAFYTVMTKRVSSFTEGAHLLPDSQFGFRKNKSTTTAASLLHEVVSGSLDTSQKIFAAFVDFKKCFDSVRRGKLFPKLLELGFPFRIIQIL